MKLSVIYQCLDDKNTKTIENLISQLKDGAELVISAQDTAGLKQYRADNVIIVKQGTDCFNFKSALKAAQGDYISFVFEGDGVSAGYVKAVMKAVESGADYYPLKWRYDTWHFYTFSGGGQFAYLFSNVYKKETAGSLQPFGRRYKFKGGKEPEAGLPVSGLIYYYRGQ